MKILVLMPLDEQHVWAATAIYNSLPHEIRDKTFAMPMFMEYLVDTKVTPNWTYALFDALYSANALCAAATEAKDDIIIIGNTSNAWEFDAVFNFQDIELELPYEDKFLEKVAEVVKDEEKLATMLKDLHRSSESRVSLKNCRATANFLAAYFATDPHLDKIIEQYKKDISETLNATKVPKK